MKHFNTNMFMKLVLLLCLEIPMWVAAANVQNFSELRKRFESYYTDNKVKVRGITVGGWLVTEPYITPSLYHKAMDTAGNESSSIIDEYTMCKALGYDKARSLMADHFATWITEDDFKQIKEDGFNLVRIPIGYWAWKEKHETNGYINGIQFEDPYVSDGLQIEYLNKALNWSKSYGLNVWIDLHGLPGSQNGFDNSGERILYGELGWLRKPNSKELSRAVLNDIFAKYMNNEEYGDTIVGIEIANEPLGGKIDMDKIVEFYYETFQDFKDAQSAGDNTTFVIHDAFQGIGFWNEHFNAAYNNVSSKYYNLTVPEYASTSVLVDHHHYEVFTDFQLGHTPLDRMIDIMNYGESLAKEQKYHPSLVGEWSGAITDCAKWLNGVGMGARYDGGYYKSTNFSSDLESKPLGECKSQRPVDEWSEEYKNQVRQFIEAQLASYSANSAGWIFWNWKTENATEWDYLKLKEANLFPTPLDKYEYFQSNGSMVESFSNSLFERTRSSSHQKSTSSSKSTSGGSGGMTIRGGTNSFLWKWWVGIAAVGVGALCVLA